MEPLSQSPEVTTIGDTISKHSKILVVQADNPDADSLGSALALEQILGEMGKSVYLYCGVNIPEYLRYLSGWDRVMDTPPSQFDASIIVDTSADSLLQKLHQDNGSRSMAKRPCIVLDHHQETTNDIAYADVVLNRPDVSSTGELIYHLASVLKWPLDVTSTRYIMTAILGDTQGLMNELATPATYRVLASIVELGVNRPELEDQRREATKMDPRIFRYKAALIDRTELLVDGRLAMVTVPQEEITMYSPLYNPGPLIQNDMLQVQGVLVSVVIKQYDDGKILAAIRSNFQAPIANLLASHFGGGGHAHAAGFKLLDGRPINQVKSECCSVAQELLSNLNSKDSIHETIQHADTSL